MAAFKKYKSIILSGITSIARIVAGFVSVKVVAITVGPGGVAILGQFQSFMQLTGNLAHLGITQGVTKYIASHKGNEEEEKSIIRTSFWITFFASFLLSILVLVFSKSISSYLFGNEKWYWILIAAAASISLGGLNQLFQAVLNGYKDMNDLIRIRTYGIIITLFFTVALSWLFGLEGALISLVLSQIAGLGILLRLGQKKTWLKGMQWLKGPDKTFTKKLLAFAAMTLLAGILTSVRQMVSRDIIEFHSDLTITGYWQALNRISDMYLMIITTSLSIYFLPRFSEIKTNTELKKEIRKGLQLIIGFTSIAALVIFTFKSSIIQIVLSDEFLPMKHLFGWQLAGDIMKMVSWILAMVLMVKEKIKIFMLLEILFAVLNLLLLNYCIRNYGMESLGLVHFISYSIYLFTVLLFVKPLLNTNHE